MHIYLSGSKSHQPGEYDFPWFLADWSKLLTWAAYQILGNPQHPILTDNQEKQSKRPR